MSEHRVKTRVRTRRWAPVTVLAIVFVFAFIGRSPTGGPGSWWWTLTGLVVGLAFVLVLHRIRRKH